MSLRRLINTILGIDGLIALPVSHARQRSPCQRDTEYQPLRLLDTRIAGFAYFPSESLLGQLNPGDLLELRRESGNIYDQRAIEIYWNQRMLGCILEIANMGGLQTMDRGEKLDVRIIWVEVQEP